MGTVELRRTVLLVTDYQYFVISYKILSIVYFSFFVIITQGSAQRLYPEQYRNHRLYIYSTVLSRIQSTTAL